MKRYLMILIALAFAAQTIFGVGARVDGIRFDEAKPNQNGAFEKLYLVRPQDGKALVPKDLAKGGVLEDRQLSVFHFNDLHGHITDQHAKKGDTHRVSQMKRIVAQARASAGSRDVVLFLSAGDEHTGTPFDELLGWSSREFVLDPAYRVLTAAGLDASVVGNHEVDRGYDLLSLSISRDAVFPVLSANITGPSPEFALVVIPTNRGSPSGPRSRRSSAMPMPLSSTERTTQPADSSSVMDRMPGRSAERIASNALETRFTMARPASM
jgi:2',3'-cyclic-nucleotide 2'-phosphodiesterase (5'-nucleotidase family)